MQEIGYGRISKPPPVLAKYDRARRGERCIRGSGRRPGGAQQSLAQAQPAVPATLAADSVHGLPRIQLMIGPGTLPSVGKDRMDLLRYRLSGNPRLAGEQMLESLPEIAKVARVEVDKGNPYDQGSYEALRKLALRAEQVLQSPDVDGLVYVQGTNTLEETAYFLSLTVHSDKPIVVTGAQRPYNALDPDKIEYYRTPHRRHTVNSEFSLSGAQSLPYVEIAYIHTGTRAGVADAMVGLGAKGIIIASVGAGAPNGLDKDIKKRSAVVVQSSRVREGRIARDNNWYEPGMVAADNLSPQKAALLLTLALSKTSNVDENSAHVRRVLTADDA
jgi:L-asparaginase/Glu-tRNA(Gln) amidotransferase subunit D